MLPTPPLTIVTASLASQEMVMSAYLLLPLKMESALIAIPRISVLILKAESVFVPLTCAVAKSPPWLSKKRADALTPGLSNLL